MELTQAQYQKLVKSQKKISDVVHYINKNWQQITSGKSKITADSLLHTISDIRWTLAMACDEMDAVFNQAKANSTLKGCKTTKKSTSKSALKRK